MRRRNSSCRLWFSNGRKTTTHAVIGKDNVIEMSSSTLKSPYEKPQHESPRFNTFTLLRWFHLIFFSSWASWRSRPAVSQPTAENQINNPRPGEVADLILERQWRRPGRGVGSSGGPCYYPPPTPPTAAPLSVNCCLATGFTLAGLRAAVCCLWPHPGIRLLFAAGSQSILAVHAGPAIQCWLLRRPLMKAFNFTRGRQMRSPNVTEIIKEEGGGICTGNFLPCVLVQPPLTNNGNQHVSTFPLPAPPSHPLLHWPSVSDAHSDDGTSLLCRGDVFTKKMDSY